MIQFSGFGSRRRRNHRPHGLTTFLEIFLNDFRGTEGGKRKKAVKRSDRQTEPAVLLISNCFSSEYFFSRYFIIRKKDFFEADPH